MHGWTLWTKKHHWAHLVIQLELCESLKIDPALCKCNARHYELWKIEQRSCRCNDRLCERLKLNKYICCFNIKLYEHWKSHLILLLMQRWILWTIKNSLVTLVDVTICFMNNEKLTKHSCECNDRLYEWWKSSQTLLRMQW
jgi:hypothetical protein